MGKKDEGDQTTRGLTFSDSSLYFSRFFPNASAVGDARMDILFIAIIVKTALRTILRGVDVTQSIMG